jgi:hypothetical protein
VKPVVIMITTGVMTNVTGTISLSMELGYFAKSIVRVMGFE